MGKGVPETKARSETRLSLKVSATRVWTGLPGMTAGLSGGEREGEREETTEGGGGERGEREEREGEREEREGEMEGRRGDKVRRRDGGGERAY